MAEQGYNGFPNVETWRVQLHLSNDERATATVCAIAELYAGRFKVWGIPPGSHYPDTFGEWLRQWVEDRTGCTEPGGDTYAMLARDTVQAALARVDWEHLSRLWLDTAQHEAARRVQS